VAVRRIDEDRSRAVALRRSDELARLGGRGALGAPSTLELSSAAAGAIAASVKAAAAAMVLRLIIVKAPCV